MRPLHSEQVIPLICSCTDCGETWKPVFSIESINLSSITRVSSNLIRAFSLARLTVACTPGSLFRAFSMRVEQAVQVIPSIGISIFLKLGGVKVIPSYVDILNNRIIGTGMSAIVSDIY